MKSKWKKAVNSNRKRGMMTRWPSQMQTSLSDMDSPVIVVRTESGAVLIDTALAALVIQHLRWSQPLRYDPLEPFSIELDGKTIYDSTLQREEYLMKQMSPVVAGAIVEALVDPNISIQKLKKRLEQVGLLEPSRKQG